jgi:Protein of unknown function (DUF2971)
VSYAEAIPDVFNPRGSCVYHYTRLSSAVESILPDGSLRMSPFSAMRDPRESKLLEIIGIPAEFVPDDWDWREEITKFTRLDQMAKRVKDRVKVLCLVRDDPSERDFETEVFGRGFARPRLWEQYGDQHRGVCLCLDQETLVADATHSVRRQGELLHNNVDYIDGELAPEAREILMVDARERADAEILAAHLKAYAQEIFFTKLTDWASEMEYRFVLPTDHEQPVLVPIRDSLKAVIIGEGVGDVYLPAISKACEEKPVPIYKVRWTYGRPRLEYKATAPTPDAELSGPADEPAS